MSVVLYVEVVKCRLKRLERLIMVPIPSKVFPDYFMIVVISLNQITKCFQQECSKYFEGFYLDDSYNRHVPPENISTIFDLQHVKDIVKVFMWYAFRL